MSSAPSCSPPRAGEHGPSDGPLKYATISSVRVSAALRAGEHAEGLRGSPSCVICVFRQLPCGRRGTSERATGTRGTSDARDERTSDWDARTSDWNVRASDTQDDRRTSVGRTGRARLAFFPQPGKQPIGEGS